jgi:hypothetical protein
MCPRGAVTYAECEVHERIIRYEDHPHELVVQNQTRIPSSEDWRPTASRISAETGRFRQDSYSEGAKQGGVSFVFVSTIGAIG